MKLSHRTIERMCQLFGHLKILERKNVRYVTSSALAKAIGATEYTIRKDISVLGVIGYAKNGYDVSSLKTQLGAALQLAQHRKACIVGLGRLGTALLDYEHFQEDGFDIVAGFDCNINKIERLCTTIDVFAITSLEDVVRSRNIDLGILTVPASEAQSIADRLVSAGVRGILNFAPVSVQVPNDIMHIDIDFTSSLRFVAACLAVQ